MDIREYYNHFPNRSPKDLYVVPFVPKGTVIVDCEPTDNSPGVVPIFFDEKLKVVC